MINSNFGFTQLKEVWLGDCYPTSFYDHLPNEVADPLRQITEWTKTDLQKLQVFLEDRGIIVQRPTFNSIENYLNKRNNLIRPPITPRDHYLTLGDTLYSLHSHTNYPIDPWQDVLDKYKNNGYHVESPTEQPVNCLCPPSLVRIGRDLFLDQDSHPHVWGFICEWMVKESQNYRINISTTNGHSDGVFCPVAPNVLVSSHYKNNYSHSFPDWEVFHVPKKYNNFGKHKEWWVNNEINQNHTFNQHIINAAQDWVGEAHETVFEVNMLVLDEHNVVCMKEYEPLTRWLEDRGIITHFFDFRTRGFWDGGWHCLTLDIHREDTKKDLFPERGDNGVYWRQE